MSNEPKPLTKTEIDKKRQTYIIFIVIGVLIILIAAGLLVYALYFNKKDPGTPCNGNNQCTDTQVCTSGYCTEIRCTKTTDCNSSVGNICSNGFCYPKPCTAQTSCPNLAVCSNGFCVSFDQPCFNTKDCRNGTLPCLGATGMTGVTGSTQGRCAQCDGQNLCTNNGTCSNKKCYSTCNNTNQMCPTGSQCVQNHCCTPGNYPAVCDDKNPCTVAGSFCVNGHCGCVKGSRGDICLIDADCAQGVCKTGKPNVCVNSTDACLSNFGNGTFACPVTTPYCNQGKCSTSTLGAPCDRFRENTETPLYNACNLLYPSTVPSGGADIPSEVYYCVNKVCQENAGTRGQTCTVRNDCEFRADIDCVNTVCTVVSN